MAEVVVFHHALGLTEPIEGFAAALRAAGHTVHTPDLLDGRTFATIEDGMAYAEEIGFPMAVVDRGRAAVESLPSEVVYVGFSLGAMPAQSLAQTRPGARGAVLWPAGWRLIIEKSGEIGLGSELLQRVRHYGPFGGGAGAVDAEIDEIRIGALVEPFARHHGGTG